MALTDLPTIKNDSMGSKFLIALAITIFVFFFTKDKKTDAM
ncbi:Uncharacterised protein [Niallia circulans]|jgi:hypothetical protein|nr:hypothetical protein [Niallia circulans]MED3837254.1 hypothetical protein [Niallia circulans]MED4244325.1 hypothetical protein [Niallia circulans]MED4248942.1 hypothetical protein [Niallia circulans]MED5101870.1 hypothetical protein [Niallia circulans]SPU11525.1 Uncharacterised protein [Niallia circulans]